MKRDFIAFFVIAFIAEAGTTSLQQFRGKSILGGGIYYDDFGALFFNRLLIWLVLYLLLSSLWLLLSRSYRKA